MNIDAFLKSEQVLLGLRTDDKASLLSKAAECTAPVTGLDAQKIAKALSDRERLGSTGMGNGVAIPHARIAGLAQPFGLLIRLDRPIEFASIDDKPVDLVFVLLTPVDCDKEHIAALSCISRRLRDQNLVRDIRAAKRAEAVYALLTG